MSNDYLELRNAYLEHAFNPKDRAQEYMQKDLDSSAGTTAFSLVRYATKYLEAEKQVANRISELNKSLGKSTQADSAIRLEIQREKNKLLQYAKNTQTAIANTNISNSGSFADRGRGKFNERRSWSNKLPHSIEPAINDIRHSDLSDLEKFGRSLRTLVSLLNNVSHSSLSHATGYDYTKKQNVNLNKKVSNERFSTGIKSKVDEVNRKGTALQSLIVSTVTEMNNMHGQINNLIKDVNAYNENVRSIRASGTDTNRQYISISITPTTVAKGFSIYKPKMILIDSDPGTYKEV